MGEPEQVQEPESGKEPRPPRAIVTLTLFPDGSMNMNGPMQDKILCLGMLTLAEHLVMQWKPEPRDQRRIITPGRVIPPGRLN